MEPTIQTGLVDVEVAETGQSAPPSWDDNRDSFRSFYEQLIDNAPDSVYITDESGTFRLINARMVELTGYTREELSTMNYLDLVAPSHRRSVKDFYLHQVMRGPELTYLEYPIITRNGHERWIGQNARILFEPRLIGFYAIARDITEKKFAEHEMQRVKKQYKDMFDFAVGPMFQSAPDGTLLNANASLAVLLGYNSATELLGVNVPQTLYVNPEDRNRLADVLNQQGSCHGIEFHLKTKKGDVITVREYSRAIHNSAGEVVMYEGILEDVTRKKEQQEKLDQYYKALRTSQENLAKVNAEKDKMVATLSHDLRSPFNSILGFCDILLSEADQLTPEERHEFISYIKESAQQQLALVNNLLDWSRFTTGRSKKKIENLDLSEIIKHSVAAHLGTAKQKGIALSSTVSNAFPLKGDGQQLIQVFNNLISNALKFTPAGGAIEIALTEMKPEEVTVAVRDSGEGIPPEDMLKLFKIDEKYTRPGLAGEKGTGFGLPLCKEIVESHGGSIRAESIVGRGTTFHVTLPLSVEGATSSEVVLVVDDNKGVRVLHAKFVKRALPHVTVIEAADGHEAVELAQRHRPRLIVADYSMPVMNGFEMLNALRRESRTKQIPVLIVTGEDSKSSTEALRLAGAVDVLRKPVTLSQLEEVLKKYIFV